MYDIAIAGAGPAGATLARLVGAKFRTLLIDGRRRGGRGTALPGGAAGRDEDEKCCGGLVAPEAQKALAEMGLSLPAGVLSGPQVFAVRAVDLSSGLQRVYQRHYINTDRGAMDRWLLSLVPDAVDLREGWSLRRVRPLDEGYELELSDGDAVRTERAMLVIGADGANSRVRRQAAPGHRRLRKYVAIQESYPRCGDRTAEFAAFFDPTVTDFYGWSIPKSGRLLVGAALPAGTDVRRRFARLTGKLRSMGFLPPRGGGEEKPGSRTAAMILRPFSADELCPVAASPRDGIPGGVALIGEAAGWISPSSAEGFSYAFRSAATAADALRAGLRGFCGRYRAATLPLKREILLKGIKSRIICSPVIRHLLLRTGVGALHVACPAAHSHLLHPAAGDIL